MPLKDINMEKKLDREVAVLMRKAGMAASAKSIRYSDLFSNKMILISLIRMGIPWSFFNLIRNYTPFAEEDWVGFLDLSSKSLLRYKQASKQFGPLQSEKIIEMAEVTHMGLDVFGSMEKFRLWLDTPNFALGKSKPKDLLKDSYGKELVTGELTRINHGILA